MRRFVNYLIILYYWSVIMKAKGVMDDPKSKYSTLISENLTMEEMDGVSDVERVGRIIGGSPRTLIKDLKHLRKCLMG